MDWTLYHSPEVLNERIDEAMARDTGTNYHRSDLACSALRSIRNAHRAGVDMEPYRPVWFRMFKELLGHTKPHPDTAETIDEWCERRFTEKYILGQE